jgi:hypothetical protein
MGNPEKTQRKEEKAPSKNTWAVVEEESRHQPSWLLQPWQTHSDTRLPATGTQPLSEREGHQWPLS